jgi:hypothetical protein
LVVGALVSFGSSQAKAAIITNGDFETGNLAGWTTFLTVNGDIGASGGFPTVVTFDVDQDSSSSKAAAFRVGRADFNLGGRRGGGLFQNVSLLAGVVNITADIAILDNVGSTNADGGLFELLFDGVVVDSHDFGNAPLGVTKSSMFAAMPIATAGIHEIRIRMGRNFIQSGVTPVQYIDDVVATQVIPEPSSLALLGIGAIALVGYGWRRKRKRAA